MSLVPSSPARVAGGLEREPCATSYRDEAIAGLACGPRSTTSAWSSSASPV